MTPRTPQASLEQVADGAWGNALHLGKAALSRWFALWRRVASGWVLIAFLEIKAAGAGAVCWFLLCCFPSSTACQLALLSHLHGKILHLEGRLSPGTPKLPRVFAPCHGLIPLPEREVLQRRMLPWRVYLMPILGTNPGKIHSELAVGGGEQWDAGDGKEMEKWEDLTA